MITNVIQIGLGPIGLDTAQNVLSHPQLRLVAAVDPAPDKSGGSLSGLIQNNDVINNTDEVTVYPSLEKALASIRQNPDIALHTTGSFLEDVTPQIVELVQNGMNVVSTTEELSYPWWHHPDEAKRIDETAKQNNVTVLGTGVNPGFVMDLFPVFISGIASSVESVYAKRVVNAEERRAPLKKKIGAGLRVEEFNQLETAGKFGHIGLAESVAMIAAALGWQLSEITGELNPKVANLNYESPGIKVPKGNVLGIDQTAIGYDREDNERIRLHLEMYVGAQHTHDTIKLAGDPQLCVTVENGISGDLATVSAVVNYIPIVTNASPGLKTALELPVPRWFGLNK